MRQTRSMPTGGLPAFAIAGGGQMGSGAAGLQHHDGRRDDGGLGCGADSD